MQHVIRKEHLLGTGVYFRGVLLFVLWCVLCAACVYQNYYFQNVHRGVRFSFLMPAHYADYAALSV